MSSVTPQRSLSQPLQAEIHRSGFAIVIALSLMSFVLLLLLAMTTLVQVESKSSARAKHTLESKQAALLSLNLAMGELQKMTGADTRVTAPANSLVGNADATPYVTGVWRSWEGIDHDSVTGRPEAPDYDIKTVDYDEVSPEDGRFLGWLVSGAENRNSADAPPRLEKRVNYATVPLLSEGALGANHTNKEVHLVPTDIDNTSVYAWWVQGLNTKALIEQAESLPEADEFAEWAIRQNSNPQGDTNSFGIPDSKELDKLASFGAFGLADSTGAVDVGEIARENYHSLTHYSRGLLTNAATGGWKRDLSLFAEKWQTLDHNYIGQNPDYRVPWGAPVSGSATAAGSAGEEPESFSTFNLSPGVSNEAGLKTAEAGDAAVLYGWTTASDKASMTWNSLADFASLYKNLRQDANGKPYYHFYNSLGPNAGGKSTANGERFSIVEPMVVRWQTILSLASQKVTEDGNTTYVPLVGVNPSVTYYNPYNVTIDSTGYDRDYLQLDWNQFPVRLTFQIDSDASVQPWRMPLLMGMNTAKNNKNRWNVKPQISSLEDQKWKPGECRIIGQPTLNGVTSGTSTVTINTGMSDLPYYTKVRNCLSSGNQSKILENGYDGSSVFKVSWARYAHSGTAPGWLRTGQQRVSYARSLDFHVSNDGADEVDEKSPINLSDAFTSVSLSEVPEDEQKFEPFLSMALTKRNLFHSYASSKGYINNKLILPPAQNSGDGIEKSSYEWRIDRLNGQVDPNTQNYNDSLSAGNDVSGFIGTSFASESGLARWVTAELPTQPLLSICELQHFDPAYISPSAPRVANALGNSHATPFIKNNELKIIDQEGYDHSYVFNHLMFDDWFVSSISPELEPFSANIVSGREIDAVLEDFYTGVGTLKNTAYLPTKLFTESTVGDYIEAIKDSETSWAEVASDIEVKGMFNVNSTSVEAWKAVLKNVKGNKVPHQTIDTESIGSWNMELGPDYEAPISRTSIVGDEFSAGNDAQVLAQPLDWTDEQLDALAEEIVKQIKLRGPFLSLSEFINRQVRSDDDELAMAGAVETALIALSEYGTGDSKNPYGYILSVFPEGEVESYEDIDGGTVEYPKYQARKFSDHQDYYDFPKAAEGHVAYGTPGWTRQADVLRPIAPILSVRDDSFTIRCYGASKNMAGDISAEAWCEATVRRTAEYVDPTNDKNDYTHLTAANKSFGRKYEVVSFRWLSSGEL